MAAMAGAGGGGTSDSSGWQQHSHRESFVEDAGTPSTPRLASVEERVLQSNPILEVQSPRLTLVSPLDSCMRDPHSTIMPASLAPGRVV